MARFKLNKLIEEASGSAGKGKCFRQVGRSVVFASTPDFDRSKVTEKQRLHRERFKRAAKYAKAAIQNADTKLAYAQSVEGQDFQNAFTAAVTDFMKAPVVDSVDNTAYHGNVGDSLLLNLFDDFKVDTVKVTISLANNTVIETGSAVKVPDSTQWKYVTTAANAAVVGSKLSVVVTDKPGNITTFEKTL